MEQLDLETSDVKELFMKMTEVIRQHFEPTKVKNKDLKKLEEQFVNILAACKILTQYMRSEASKFGFDIEIIAVEGVGKGGKCGDPDCVFCSSQENKPGPFVGGH